MKRRLPRAPLPRQTGGVHKVKTKVKHRKRKHKGYDDGREDSQVQEAPKVSASAE